MAGIASLVQKITYALSLVKVAFKGSGGIGEMLSDGADIMLQRTVLTTSNLSAVSPSDARLVAIRGVALYAYNPSTDPSGSPLNVAVAGGGFWEYLCALGKDVHVQVIGNSTAGDTSFTITHDLNTLTPTILCYEPAAPGGTTGYRLRDITALAAVTTVDANNTLIDFGATVPASNQYTIIAKK